MTQVWGMINGMQIYLDLPLFKVQFPELSFGIVEALLEIAGFEVLPMGDWMSEYALESPELELDDTVGSKDEKFVAIGYESNLMITNLGSMFVTLVFILLIPIWLFLLRPCKNKYQWLHTKHTSLTNSIYGNLYIRYLLEGCLDIAISLTLQVTHMGSNGLEWDTTFNVINNITTIVLGVATISFPVFIIVFYCRKFQ